MPLPADQDRPIILLAGGTGYIGARLTPLLERERLQLRCLARSPEKLRCHVKETTEIVPGDVLDVPSLDGPSRELRRRSTLFTEGLRNPTVVRDTKARDVFNIRPMGIQAIQKAVA